MLISTLALLFAISNSAHAGLVAHLQSIESGLYNGQITTGQELLEQVRGIESHLKQNHVLGMIYGTAPHPYIGFFPQIFERTASMLNYFELREFQQISDHFEHHYWGWISNPYAKSDGEYAAAIFAYRRKINTALEEKYRAEIESRCLSKAQLRNGIRNISPTKLRTEIAIELRTAGIIENAHDLIEILGPLIENARDLHDLVSQLRTLESREPHSQKAGLAIAEDLLALNEHVKQRPDYAKLEPANALSETIVQYARPATFEQLVDLTDARRFADSPRLQNVLAAALFRYYLKPENVVLFYREILPRDAIPYNPDALRQAMRAKIFDSLSPRDTLSVLSHLTTYETYSESLFSKNATQFLEKSPNIEELQAYRKILKRLLPEYAQSDFMTAAFRQGLIRNARELELLLLDPQSADERRFLFQNIRPLTKTFGFEAVASVAKAHGISSARFRLNTLFCQRQLLDPTP